MDMLAYFLGKQSGGGGGGGGDFGDLMYLCMSYYTEGEPANNEDYYISQIAGVFASDEGVLRQMSQIAAGATVTFGIVSPPSSTDYSLALFSIDLDNEWLDQIGTITADAYNGVIYGGTFTMPEVDPDNETVCIGIVPL